MYTKESLETLKHKIDLVEVVSSHIDLKRTGSAYKACCPFHHEKSPSFTIQKGGTHYHCFGCGAHGDAISFLMLHLGLGFTEAIEQLSDQFHSPLERTEGGFEQGPDKRRLRGALEKSSEFFHFYLLESLEGKEALDYLFARGIDLEFIRQFRIGLAPSGRDVFRKVLHAEKFDDQTLLDSGLLMLSSTGKKRELFSERITIPIQDRVGTVIGFSARKYREETFGGKYVNSPETPLFKKSRVLFGISHSRARMIKEGKVLIVEGQIDALRLIQEGFDYTIAGQGTAFGQEHAKEVMSLGVKEVILAMDGDGAGREAAAKIGELFQKHGIEVKVVPFGDGEDPDSVLREKGPAAMQKLIDSSDDYLTFLVAHRSVGQNVASPAVKNSLAKSISDQIRAWDGKALVFESLRKLAKLLSLPESVIGIENFAETSFVRKKGRLERQEVDPDEVLEGDLIRWLLLLSPSKPQIIDLARANLSPELLRTPAAHAVYAHYLADSSCDLMSLASHLSSSDQKWVEELLRRKVNLEKGEAAFSETLQRLLMRDWMDRREAIAEQLRSGNLPDDDALALAKEFDTLRKSPPTLTLAP